MPRGSQRGGGRARSSPGIIRSSHSAIRKNVGLSPVVSHPRDQAQPPLVNMHSLLLEQLPEAPGEINSPILSPTTQSNFDLLELVGTALTPEIIESVNQSLSIGRSTTLFNDRAPDSALDDFMSTIFDNQNRLPDSNNNQVVLPLNSPTQSLNTFIQPSVDISSRLCTLEKTDQILEFL